MRRTTSTRAILRRSVLVQRFSTCLNISQQSKIFLTDFYAMVFLLLPSDVWKASPMMEFLLPSPLREYVIDFFVSHPGSSANVFPCFTRLPDVSPLLMCTTLVTSFLIQPSKSASHPTVRFIHSVVVSAKATLMCLTESVTCAWP